jgi:hypothetical protein
MCELAAQPFRHSQYGAAVFPTPVSYSRHGTPKLPVILERQKSMSYVSLMVHIDVEGELSARVSIAAELADRFRARLIGVAGWAPMSVFLGERAPDRPNPNLPELQDMKSVLDQKREQFYAAIGKNGRQLEWRSALDFPTDVLAREARRRTWSSLATRRGIMIRFALSILEPSL